MAPKTNFLYKYGIGTPLKTVPGSGFVDTRKINENTRGKSMFFDGPKPYEKYCKTNTFPEFWSFTKMMKKRCQRGPQKSCFLIQNDDMGLPGSTYPLIFDVLV